MNKLLPRIFTILLLGSIVSNSSVCYADTVPNAYRIVKGEKAPFDGIELSDSYAQEVYKQLNDYDHLKLINASLEKSVDLYKQNEIIFSQEISELKAQNIELDTSLRKASSNSFWKNALWFIIGVAATGSAVYVAKQIK